MDAHAYRLVTPKRHKYGVSSKADRTVDGITFDSKGEMLRWLDLRNLERAGAIRALEHRVPYALVVNGQPVCKYYADFAYYEKGKLVVEDFKSAPTRTPGYRLKAKLMKALHGITIKETGR